MTTPYKEDRWHDLESLLALVESAWFTEESPLTVHSKNYDGDTPLHTVVRWEDKRGVEVLIKAGADVNACGEDDYRPLHEAARHKQPEIVKLLLKAGASKEVKNAFDKTPLELARLHKYEDVIKLLV